jgi:hypothetical protein
MSEMQARLAAARKRAEAAAAALNMDLDQYIEMVTTIDCTALREKLAELEAGEAARQRDEAADQA